MDLATERGLCLPSSPLHMHTHTPNLFIAEYCVCIEQLSISAGEFLVCLEDVPKKLGFACLRGQHVTAPCVCQGTKLLWWNQSKGERRKSKSRQSAQLPHLFVFCSTLAWLVHIARCPASLSNPVVWVVAGGKTDVSDWLVRILDVTCSKAASSGFFVKTLPESVSNP